MKPLPLILGFAAGFVLAIVFGLAVVLPASREMWRVNVDSDVHRACIQAVAQTLAAPGGVLLTLDASGRRFVPMAGWPLAPDDPLPPTQ